MMMTLDAYDLLETGAVQLRFAEGQGRFHREVRWPGADISDLPEDVRAEIGEHWTPARVSAYEAARAAAEAEIEAMLPPMSERVDTERDRRIAAGFAFAGKHYQSRPEDRENIAGAATAALAAMVAGALPGDLRWHGGDSDFVWIAADNSLTPMDAHTMFAFGQAAMAHKQAHIFAARQMKDADPVPTDYHDDGYWPDAIP